MCPECGQFPDTLIMDGTCLGLRKDLLPLVRHEDAENLPEFTGTEIKDRTYLPDQSTRNLLRRFALGEEKTRLTDSQMNALGDKLANIRPVLGMLVATIALDENCAPSHYRNFLLELAKNTPMCAFLQYGFDIGVKNILHRIIEGNLDIASSRSSKEFSKLRKSCPALVDMICRIRKEEAQLSDEFRDVLREMTELVETTFSKPRRDNSEYPRIETVPTELSFFPQWPIVRGLGKYKVPNRGSKDEADACLKHKHGHPVLSPGILTIYCRHSVCYGYTIMESYESVRMPFEVIMTRFPTAPKLVIYDFCCKLHVYFLKREPKFVESTSFMVDRFHWKNHKACSVGYDLNQFRNSHMDTINSQANEQQNAHIAKLKSSLSYMTLHNFKTSLQLFLLLRNKKSVKKLTG